jgi:SpoVK/Ycf46/Vps4 family AAA+-type ATPase
MANASQLKALLKAYGLGDQRQFLSIAEQLAAHESRLGHKQLADELGQLISDVRGRSQSPVELRPVIPITLPKGELSGLLSVSYPKQRLADLVLPKVLRQRLERIIKEQRHAARIRAHGLTPRRKILFIGPPGTGKTLSAAVLAGELALPLFEVRLERLITKFMGETAAKLRLIFDAIAQSRGIYLFDEFDSIGSQRGMPNDIGEIRRVLNSFLQFIEGDASNSLILAATNHPELLDYALFRRFDDVIRFELPRPAQISELLQNRLASATKSWKSWRRLTNEARGMSYAEIARSCDDAIKQMVITNQNILSEEEVVQALRERKVISRT